MNHMTLIQQKMTTALFSLQPAAVDNAAFKKLFKDWQKSLTTLIKDFTNSFLLPVILGTAVLALLVQIGMFVYMRHQGRGEDAKKIGIGIGITIAVMIVLGSASVWAWTLIK